MTDDDLTRLRDRLARLERRQRRGRALLAGGAVCLLLTAADGATREAEHFEHLRCEGLELVDRHGQVLGAFEVDAETDEPVLRLKNEHGHAILRVGAKGAGLALGRPSAGVSYLGVTDRGPYLNVRGADLRRGIWSGVTEDGDAGFRAYGESLRVGVRMEVEADGDSKLELSDGQGRPLESLPRRDA